MRLRQNRTAPGRRPKKSVPELIVHIANRLNEKRMIFSRVVFHQREAPTGYGTSSAGGRRRRSAPSAVPGSAYSAPAASAGRRLEESVIACHPPAQTITAAGGLRDRATSTVPDPVAHPLLAAGSRHRSPDGSTGTPSHHRPRSGPPPLDPSAPSSASFRGSFVDAVKIAARGIVVPVFPVPFSEREVTLRPTVHVAGRVRRDVR